MSNTTVANNFCTVNAVLLCAVNFIFMIAGIFLNCVVIMSIVMNTQLQKKLCYFMILVLACFDLAVVIVFHPLITVEVLLRWSSTTDIYAVDVIILEHLFSFALVALLTMTLERYLALVYPFFHHKFMTKSKIIGILATMQLPFGITHLVRGLGENPELYLESCMLGLVMTVILVLFYLNYKIFDMVKTLRRRADVNLGNFIDGNVPENNSELRNVKFSLKKISTCILAVVCLSLCYFPPIITLGIRILNAGLIDNHDDGFSSCDTMCVIRLWEDTLLTINSTLNSLIFFYKNDTLRRHGKELVKKLFSRQTELF